MSESVEADFNPQYWLEQAELFLQAQQLRQAVDCFLRLLQYNPHYLSIRFDVCVLLIELNDWPLLHEVLAGFTDASPQAAQAHAALGVYYEKHQRSAEALPHFIQALQYDPAPGMYWNYQARSLLHLGRFSAAQVSIQQAVLREPDRAEHYFLQGVIAQATGQLKDAECDFVHCLALDPACAPVYPLLIAHYKDQRRYEQARQCMEQALRCSPEADFLLGMYLMLNMEMACWVGWAQQVQAIGTAIDAGHLVALPLPLLAIPVNVVQQNRNAQKVVESVYPDRRVLEHRRRRPGRLRVVYVSSDIGAHAVSILMAGFLTQHEVQDIEVFLYSSQNRVGDPLLQRISTQVEHFVDISGMEDAAVRELAKEQDIDIAIDLNGHTQGGRTRLFASGLAPIQVHYLGFPGGMGASYYDYILADSIVIPPEHRCYYREQVVYLPGCFQVNDEQREPPQRLTRKELGWPEHAFVFCCCNATYKLNPIIFQWWLSILRQCPDALFVVLGDTEEIRRNVRNLTQEGGVDPDRLYFAKRLHYAEHLGRLAEADLVLDTVPFNGGTSTSDALWAGVPVLTCTGDTFAGRMTTSLLHHAGLVELICPTPEAYVERAVELCRHGQWLKSLRGRLATEAVRQRLFATAPLTRAIERAYVQMQQRYLQGQAAESFYV